MEKTCKSKYQEMEASLHDKSRQYVHEPVDTQENVTLKSLVLGYPQSAKANNEM